jgi:hypothetical protein
MILLTDIKLAMDQFEEPSAAGNPDEKSVLALSQELQQLGQFAITTPQP